MNREQAINYLISSGFSEEQVSEVVKALTYQPTTKNDLGVDCISRERLKQIVFNITAEYDTETIHIDRLIDEIDNLPSVTPQEPRWIPVTEGLPASYKEVLITNGTVTCIGWISPTDRCWRSDSESKYDIYYDTVAWMPLPKPYEPQESEVEE